MSNAPVNRSRQVRLLTVDGSFLLRAWKDGAPAFRPVSYGLPEDAELLDATYDSFLGVLRLFVRSDTFREIPEGMPVPSLDPPVLSVLYP